MSSHAHASLRAALGFTLALLVAVTGLSPALAAPHAGLTAGAVAVSQASTDLGRTAPETTAENPAETMKDSTEQGVARSPERGAEEPVEVLDGLDQGAGPALDEAVTTALEQDESVSVLVHLRDQVDLSEVSVRAAGAGMAAEARSATSSAAAAHDAGKRAQTATVVRELKAVAGDPSHGRVRAVLAAAEKRGAASDVKEYWIVNAFSATIDRDTAAALAEHADVDHLELDVTFEAPEATSEPLLPTWGLEKIQAPRTWGSYDHRGEGVVVAVLDTGVDGGHPALAPSYRGSDGDHSDSWYVPTGENYPTPYDAGGHGTHVTGTITGGAPGQVVGVAPEAEWIGVKIFDDSGRTTDSTILDAAQWVLAPGGDPAKAPDVVNNSWGHPDAHRTIYWDSVEAWRAAGIFPVFANGNDGPASGTVGSPGSFPISFGVGATDANDEIASFSSRGPVTWDGEEVIKPDVSAPGDQILSTWPRNLGRAYNTISGTSMATPHVTGAVALLLSANPDLSIDEIWQTLEGTARVEPHMGKVPNNDYGHGIIDTYAATAQVAHSGRLTGTVTGPDGPLEARISVDNGDFEVVSDPATGSYAVTVPTGGADITVSAYGYLTQTLTLDVGVGERVHRDISLQVAPTSLVSGTVTAGGVPAAGAVVAVNGTASQPVAEAVTNDEGTYQVAVPHGTYRLRAGLAGYLPGTQEADVDSDLTLDFDLATLTTPALDGWSQGQNGPARTGLTRDGVTPSTLAQTWVTDVDLDVFFSSPVVAHGRVYLSTTTGAASALTALDSATGEKLWSHRAGSNLRSTPAVTEDAVFVSDGGGNAVLALDPATGAELWRYSTGAESTTYGSPAVLGGVVYVSTGLGADNGGFVHALDATTGERIWRAEIGPQAAFGPAVGEGIVVAGSWQTGALRALDAVTGDLVWEYVHPTDGFLATPSIADGSVYVGTQGSGGGSLLALDSVTGQLQWEAADHGGAQASAPAVYHDTVIAGSHSKGWVRAYDRASGELRWTHTTRYAVSSPQAVSADGVVIGGSQSGIAFALDATTGAVLWEQELSGGILSAPAIADGTVYLTTLSGEISAWGSSGTLTGTISGPDGPVAAHLEVAETGTSVTAAADGAYQLAHRPGTWTVRTSAYGYATTEDSIRIVGGQQAGLDISLVPVGTGSLTGMVTTPEGPAVGATVSVQSPAGDEVVPTTRTGADGNYVVAPLSAGEFTVTIDADGYAPFTGSVTIGEEAGTVLDATLQRYDVAVVADHEGQVAEQLLARDWSVDEVSFAEVLGTATDYRAIVLVGTPQDPATEAGVSALVAEADEAGVSLVALDQVGPDTGSVEELLSVTGTGTLAEESNWRGTTWAQDVLAHPITASLPIEGSTDLLSSVDATWIDDFAGTALARVGTYSGGARGTVIGLVPRTASSAHVLLPLHAPTDDVGPDTSWLPVMTDILDDAVGWAADAEFGEVTGTVTGPDGTTLEVDVEVVGGRSVRTGAEGYRLLLEPGDYTLRVSAAGWSTQDQQVSISSGTTQVLNWSLVAAESGTVTGQVTDQTGAVVVGAEVLVDGTELHGTSTADGSYTIGDVPAGTWSLAATADGHTSSTRDGVQVTSGETTELDFTLGTAPSVAVVGDRSGILTAFLNDQGIPARATGWEVTADLTDIDVAILALPTDPGETAFTAHLAALDEAGVGVIAAGGLNSATLRGAYLVEKYLGDPADVVAVGGGGQNLAMTGATPHPAFAGLPAELPWQVSFGGESAAFRDHSGVPIATITADGQEERGAGAVYYPTANGNVMVLAGGLGATFRIAPETTWTPEGKSYYLNLLRWAADPALGSFEGRVTGPGGFVVPEASITFPQLGYTVTTDAAGEVSHALHTGTFEVAYSAFGFEDATATVTITEGATGDVSIELVPAAGGTLTGTISSGGSTGTGSEGHGSVGTAAGGVALEGAQIRVLGTPRVTTTAADGTFTLPFIAPGDYEVEIRDDNHVRQVVPVTVAAGESVPVERTLRVSPVVGVLYDFVSGGRPPVLRTFLEHWGYRVTDLTWADADALADVDFLIANGANFGDDPTPSQFAAFDEALTRNGVSTLWLGTQFGRGTILYLTQQVGDPDVEGYANGRGVITAHVADGQDQHPLLTGVDVTDGAFPLVKEDRGFQWFTGYSGTTIASLSSTEDGPLGDTIAVKGRATGAVDILLSTLATSPYGQPSMPGAPSLTFTPESEQVFLNSLDYAMDARDVGAEVRGTVTADGATVPSTVTVVESGREYAGRSGDGTFLVPLDPGSWTLEISSYGYQTQTRQVTVEAGDSARLDVSLTADVAATIEGTVSDPAGAPLEGVTATVGGRTALTDATGRYRLATVPVGDRTVTFSGDGLRTETRHVTLEEGQALTLDVTVSPAASLALVGDRNSDLEEVLVDASYEVDTYAYNRVADLTPLVAGYDVVVVNGFGTKPGQADFQAFLDAAQAAEVSVVFTGQYFSGSIRHLTEYVGDPVSVPQGSSPNLVNYKITTAHPIFAGYEVGETIPILTRPGANVTYQSFEGYSGVTLAELASEDGSTDLGDGLAYRFTSPGSVHLLLGSLAASSYGTPADPNRWTPQAYEILLNGIDWSVDASQSVITGVVTSGGAPVAGATVRATEAGATASTTVDGTYRLGVPPGTHTVEVTKTGYASATGAVTVADGETGTLDLELVKAPRGSVQISVLSTTDDTPVEGAAVTLGSEPGETGGDGTVVFDDLLPGNYPVLVSAAGHLDGAAEAVVEVGVQAEVVVRLQPNEVLVLGDTDDRALTGFLVDSGVAAASVEWADAAEALVDQRVVVVNGGEPSESQFEDVVATADEENVDVIFLGTHGIGGGGGTALLAEFGEGYEAGGQGYGDGAVTLTGFTADHPLFAGLTDPASVLADNGYYSLIGAYPGEVLAELSVAQPPRGGSGTGSAVAYEFRGARDMHLVLSFLGVSDYQGPDLGWTPDAETLLLNALDWVGEAELAPPVEPSLTTAETLVDTPQADVRGVAADADAVTITVDGVEVAEVTPDEDGLFTASLALTEGPNAVIAMASNVAGSTPSQTLVVTLDTTAPQVEWSPEDDSAFLEPEVEVSGTASDAHAGLAELTVNGAAVLVDQDGSFATTVALQEGPNTIVLTATDALGHTVTQERNVHHYALDVAVQLPSSNGAVLPVTVLVTDSDGTPTQVDGARVVAVHTGDVVAGPLKLKWTEDQFKGQLRGIPRGIGDVQIVVTVTVDGHEIEVPAVTVTR